MLKILYIGNTAGVASIIAKYMDRLFDTRSKVVQRSNRFGFTPYGEPWNCGAKMFTLKSLCVAKKFDIVHVNYFDKIVPFLKFLYHKKRVVLHYHGDDIRGKWSLRRKYWSKADFVLYSTPELKDKETPETAIWLPTPVDTDLFYPFQHCVKKPNSALSMDNNLDVEKAKRYARKYGLRLTFQSLTIPYLGMPKLLNQYEYYIDTKTPGDASSKTGLEALACGLKVINYYGEVMEGLPEEHKPENVVRRVHERYVELLGV